jgi:two-component system, OmpR family, response regulator
MAGNVLVVDDDGITRKYVSRFLNRQGYNVVYTADAMEALERFSQEHFDLVVSDLVMPGMDGLNLAVRIHSLAPNIPIIIMSGHDAVEKENVLRAGAADFIEKPVLLDDLLSKIKNTLDS